MSISNIPTFSESMESVEGTVENRLEALEDFSIELLGFQELLPELEAKSTFIATSLIENICSMNPKAVKVLNKEV